MEGGNYRFLRIFAVDSPTRYHRMMLLKLVCRSSLAVLSSLVLMHFGNILNLHLFWSWPHSGKVLAVLRFVRYEVMLGLIDRKPTSLSPIAVLRERTEPMRTFMFNHCFDVSVSK